MTDPFERAKHVATPDAIAARLLVGRLADMLDRLQTVERSNNISRGSVVGKPLAVYDEDETLAMEVGEQYDGSFTAQPVLGPPPPIPTQPSLTPGLRSLTVRWDGEWEVLYGEDGQVVDPQVVAPMDFSRVEIHASTDPDFDAQTIATLVGTFETPRGGETLIPVPTTGEDYTVRLVARTQSGKRSDPSIGSTVAAEDVQTSDGAPPTTSPTPIAIGRVGGIYLAWDAVPNADPVTYRIYADSVPNVAITDATRIADVSDTAFEATVWRFNPLSRVPYDVDTYFRIVAVDEDGAAPPGPVVNGRATRVTTADLNDGAVSLAKLATDTSNALANAASAAAQAMDAADDALTAAQAAQATADGAIRTWYQSDPPDLSTVTNRVIDPAPSTNYWTPSSATVATVSFLTNSASGRRVARSTRVGVGAYALYGARLSDFAPPVAEAVGGMTFTLMYAIESSAPTTIISQVGHGTGSGSINEVSVPHDIEPGARRFFRRVVTLPMTGGWTGGQLMPKFYQATGAVDSWFEVSDVLWVEGEYDGPYFDGNTPPTPDVTYGWAGAANRSVSRTYPAAVLGDLWFDVDDGTAYRWNGSAWVLIQDSSIAAALAAAQNAQTTADGKITAYYQATTPTVGDKGDIWYDTANGNRPYYCSSESPLVWTPIPAGLQALGPDVSARALGAVFTYYTNTAPSLTTTREGDLWVDTANGNRLYRRGPASWVVADDVRLQQALTAASNAQSTADGKIRMFAQNDPPTGLTATDVGDLWVDTNDGNHLYRWSGSAWVDARDTTIAAANAAAANAQNAADTALIAAQDAAATADGKVAAYFQNNPPTGLGPDDAGDLWFDLDDGNRLYRWSGSAWVDARDTTIAAAAAAAAAAQGAANQAIADAADAAAIADGKTRAYFQGTAPVGLAADDVGDLWFDTANGNRMSRWSGSAWVLSDDQRIAQAITAANGAQTTANSRITSFYQGTPPTSLAVGDLWVDTANSNRLYRANKIGANGIGTGPGWVDARDATIAAASAAASSAQTAATNAMTAAQAAQATADGAIRTYYQANPPWTSNADPAVVGDMWFDTDDGQAYRWNGSAWQVIQDSGIAAALAAAQNAQTTADGKITAYYANARPWADGAAGHANDVGDLWYNLADKNRPYYWSGTAWVEIRDQAISDAMAAAGAAQAAANAAAADAAAAQAEAEQAIADAADAAAIADGKTQTYFQGTAPGGMAADDVGDLWFDTANGNRMYRWTGSTWALSDDQRIAQAVTAANDANTAAGNAQTAANNAAAAAAAAAAGAENRVTNGGAENGLTDWTTGAAGVTSVTEKARTGSRSFKTTGSGNINQGPIPVRPGQVWRYEWNYQTAAAYATGASGGLRLQASNDGNTWTDVGSTSLTGNMTDWTAQQVEYTVPASGVKFIRARLAFNYTGGAAAWFDDIRLTDVSQVKQLEAAAAAAQTAANNAQTTANSKITTFYQTTPPPVSLAVGDMWVHTGDNNRLYRANKVGANAIGTSGGWVDARDATIATASAAAAAAQTAAGNAQTAAANAQATADGAIRTFYQSNAPWANGSTQPAASVGDLWFDTDDSTTWRWDGSAWIKIEDPRISSALAAAQNAQTTADGKITAYYANARPWADGASGHAEDVGDLWYDIANGNRPYYWSGTAWVLIQDAAIAAAQNTANSKITTFHQGTPPTSLAVGDLWVDTANGNRLYRANKIGANAIGTAGGWIDSRDATIAAASAAASAAQSAANAAQTAAEAAQATADGAIRTYYQANPPWTTNPDPAVLGDMWFDTDDGQAYRWNGSTWQVIQDSGIAAALAAAQNAQTTADGKITSYYASTRPWADGAAGHANDVGDLWFDTANGNRSYYWSGTAWVALPFGLGALASEVTARNLGAITTTVAASAPGSPKTGDLWMDTANSNRLKRWSGSAWVDVRDTGIQSAINSAASAANLADEKMRIFYEPKSANGMYPASNPTMLAADGGDLWFRTDEGNRPYRYNGSLWLAFTFGADGIAASDGQAPTGAPSSLTVTPGVRCVFLRWAAVSNRDPVTYRVYGAKTSGFTPDPSNFIGEVSGTALTVQRLPGEATAMFDPEITPDTIAYFKVIAADADGPSATSSPQASGSARRVDGGDVAFESLTSAHIAVGSLIGTLFSGELVLGSRISTGAIDENPDSPTYGEVVGQRVEFGPAGLDIIDTTDQAFIHFPTDPSDTAFVRARLESDELRVTGGTSIESTTNEIARGGGMTLNAAVAPPVSSPTMTFDYDRVALQRTAIPSRDPSGGSLGTFALQPERMIAVGWHVGLNHWLVAERVPGGVRIWHFTTAGLVARDFNNVLWADDLEGFSTVTGLWGYAGQIDTGYIGKRGNDWILVGRSGTSANGVSQYNRLPAPQNPDLNPIGMFDPATNRYCVLENRIATSGARAVRVREFTVSSTFWAEANLTATHTSSTSGVSNGYQPVGLMRGTFDIGVNRFAWAWRGIQNGVMFSAVVAGAGPDSPRRFTPATPPVGMDWDGSNFWVLGSDGYLYKHTTWQWTDDLDYIHAGMTWYDDDTAGTPMPPSNDGRHETGLGAIATVLARKRAKLRVNLPAVPDKGGVDDPNKWRLYMLRSGAGKPPAAQMIYQTEGGNPTYPQTLVMQSLGTGDTKRPPTGRGNFPGSNPAFFKGAGKSALDGARDLLYMDGNGRGNWDEVAPPGSVQFYAGINIQTAYGISYPEITPGWLLCRGDVVSRAAYPALFAAIGTTFNTGGEASTDFRLPDVRRRTLFGWASNAEVGLNDGLPELSRNIGHTHTVPNHTHSIPGQAAGSSTTRQAGTTAGQLLAASSFDGHNHGGSTGSSGSGSTGSASLPYLFMNAIIKY